jgi:hypothetical protein
MLANFATLVVERATNVVWRCYQPGLEMVDFFFLQLVCNVAKRG